MSGILRGNYYETCRNIPQKTPMNGFYREEFFNKTDAFSERLRQRLIN